MLSFPFRDDRRLQTFFYRYGCSSLILLSSLLSAAVALFLVGATLFLLWPSYPHLSVARISIDRVHVSLNPSVSMSIDLHLRISVRNPDFFSLDYDALDIAIDYRGQRLGSVLAVGGHVRVGSIP